MHGDESGSVDRLHNLYGAPVLSADEKRHRSEDYAMLQEPYTLDEQARAVVLESIRQHCAFRGWNLLAAHVRSNHVHVVLEADCPPERILNEFKSYASRALNGLGRDAPNRKRWARHGSTRWLWRDEAVDQAIRYVVEEQGDPMALYVREDF